MVCVSRKILLHTKAATAFPKSIEPCPVKGSQPFNASKPLLQHTGAPPVAAAQRLFPFTISLNTEGFLYSRAKKKEEEEEIRRETSCW